MTGGQIVCSLDGGQIFLRLWCWHVGWHCWQATNYARLDFQAYLTCFFYHPHPVLQPSPQAPGQPIIAPFILPPPLQLSPALPLLPSPVGPFYTSLLLKPQLALLHIFLSFSLPLTFCVFHLPSSHIFPSVLLSGPSCPCGLNYLSSQKWLL